MSITTTLLAMPAPSAPVYAHPGFVLAMRREMLAMLQDAGSLGTATRLLGIQIIESEGVPPGHFIVNGISYRYTKPTVDEMARHRLGVFGDNSLPSILQRQAV